MVAYALRAAKFCPDIVERYQHDRSSATERDFDFILNLHDRSDEIFRCEIRFEIGEGFGEKHGLLRHQGEFRSISEILGVERRQGESIAASCCDR